VSDPITGTPLGRRASNRLARHEQLMSAATEIVAERGLEGLTMQAVAERTDCAVGTIYTYFRSKSALLVELQISAIATIQETYELSRAMWDEELAAAGSTEREAALFRLVAFGHLFTSGADLFPREFELLQTLISTPRRPEAPGDGERVLPHAFALIMSIGRLIDDAARTGAIDELPADEDRTRTLMVRTMRWAGGLNGALLVSNATGDAEWLPDELLDGRMLARQLARDLLAGWGATRVDIAAAERFAEELASRDRLLRAGHRLGHPATVDLTD
jgi:AcrR family transcriptional regulator